MGESIAVLDGFNLSSISVSPDDADGRIGQVRAGVPGMEFASDMSPDDADGRIGQMRAGTEFASYDVSPDAADGRIGQTRAFANQYARQVGPGTLAKENMIQASNGANYAGGSSWYPGAPTMPASVGLASMGDGYGRAGLGRLADGYGRAGLGDGYGRAGLGGCAGCGGADADLSSAFEAYDSVVRQTQPGVLVRDNVVDYSGGANYGGGSSFYPGGPTMPSSVGLADADMDPVLLAYMNAENPDLPNTTFRNNVIDPSGGANYTGGSSFAPGSPLLVSSAGLAELRSIDALDQRNTFPMLSADARTLFQQLAGRDVLRKLHASVKSARAQKNGTLPQTLRQFAIARRIRRAVAMARGVVNRAVLNNIAMQVAAQVARAPMTRAA